MRRSKLRLLLPTLAAGLVWASPGTSNAEGTRDLGNTQALRAGTTLFVDILDSSVESIEWTGAGSVTVTSPDGAVVGSLGSGQSTGDLSNFGDGAYRVVVGSAQYVFSDWDVSVLGQTDSKGRLFSYNWSFNAGAFSSDRATSASFFAVVPGGGVDQTSVIELKLEGLAGYVYDINANRVGVDGPNGGRSVSWNGNSTTPEFAIYLNPPTNATYSASSPLVNGLEFVGGVSLDYEGNPMQACSQVVPGGSTGQFQFTSTGEGSYHLSCDLNKDGEFDPVGGDDLLLVGSASAGLNEVAWDGTHNGELVALGTYDCRAQVNVGEFHYVGADIETSFPGMRLYEVHPDEGRSPLRMYWNDSSVQDNAQAMPNGEPGLESSGSEGVFPGPYGSSAVANVNARAWGNFNSTGKGNQAYLDTYTWLESSATASIQIEAVDPFVDSDADGAGDFEEACAFGTDPFNPDTDGDEVPDGQQYGGYASSGGGNGLESNGRLSTALARRAIRRTRLSEGPSVGFRSASDLDELMPEAGTLGSTSADVTPTDLPSITNAASTHSLDYFDRAGRRVGGVLLIETTGEVYEHSKLVCDRASGAAIDDMLITDVGGHDVLRATTRRDGVVDHTAVFSLYPKGDGAGVYAYWLTNDYPTPSAGERVIRVQAWSSVPGGELTLARRVLERAGSHFGELRAPGFETPRDDEAIDRDAPYPEPMAQTSLPAAAVASASLLAGELRLDLRRYGLFDQDVVLRTVALQEDAVGQRVEEHTLEEDEGWIDLNVGRALDVTAELVVDGQVHDQVWLSDGAWAAYDDGLWGGVSRSDFTRSGCTPSSATGHLAFAGCARAEGVVQGVGGFGGVARHFARPVPLDGVRSVSVRLLADAPVRLCLHAPEGEHHCTSLPPGHGERRVALADFKSPDGVAPPPEARTKLLTISTSQPGAFVIEAAGLVLSSEEVEPTSTQTSSTSISRPVPEESGCSVDLERNGPLAVILLALVGLRRRRRG